MTYGTAPYADAAYADESAVLAAGAGIGWGVGVGTGSGVSNVNAAGVGSGSGVGTGSGEGVGIATISAAGSGVGVGTGSGVGYTETILGDGLGVGIGLGVGVSFVDLATSTGLGAGVGTGIGGGARLWSETLTDGFDYAVVARMAWNIVLPQTITSYSGLPSYDFRPGALASDVASYSQTVSSAGVYPRGLADTQTTADILRWAFPMTLGDTTTYTPSLLASHAKTVLEQLNLAPAAATQMSYRTVLSQTLSLSDSLLRFLGGDLADTHTTTPVTTPLWRPARSLADTTTLSDALSSKLLLRLVLADELTIDDADLEKMIFGPTLVDGIEITAAYISPDNTVTTWAVNTKTGGTTEYTNYNFNSFARMGRKFLGASSAGLFELNGDTDNTVDIIADIKGGYAQFGGSRFTSFAAAYLGLRADGNFTLRLITGDGLTYDYLVKSHSMKTTKVNMGKGLRARYFAYELISTGQDFDLDSVEFVPLVAQRRV